MSHDKTLNSGFYFPLLKSEIGQSLKNYNYLEPLKIHLFSEHERYFINELISLKKLRSKIDNDQTKNDEPTTISNFSIDFAKSKMNVAQQAIEYLKKFANAPSPTLTIHELKKHISQTAEKRFSSFCELLKIISITYTDTYSPDNDSPFDMDKKVVYLKKDVAEKLKEHHFFQRENIVSLETALNDPKNYGPGDQSFAFNCLSEPEISFVDYFKKILPETDPIFENFANKLGENYQTKINKTGLNIQPIVSPTFTGRLCLSSLDQAKLEKFYSKKDSSNPSNTGGSPISQPTQPTTTTTTTTTQQENLSEQLNNLQLG